MGDDRARGSKFQEKRQLTTARGVANGADVDGEHQNSVFCRQRDVFMQRFARTSIHGLWRMWGAFLSAYLISFQRVADLGDKSIMVLAFLHEES